MLQLRDGIMSCMQLRNTFLPVLLANSLLSLVLLCIFIKLVQYRVATFAVLLNDCVAQQKVNSGLRQGIQMRPKLGFVHTFVLQSSQRVLWNVTPSLTWHQVLKETRIRLLQRFTFTFFLGVKRLLWFVNHYLVLESPALISPELLIARVAVRLHLLIFLLVHLHILDQF